MQWIQLGNTDTEISATPVAWEAYVRFARDTGRSMPPRTGSPLLNFATGTSATDASAFAQWIAQQNGGHYRLPTLDEMLALAHQARDGLHIWPYRFWRDGFARDYFYEWLACSPDQAETGPRRRCVTHPAWLFTHPPRSMRAALVDTAYPFVVFRLVRSRTHDLGPLKGRAL